MTQVQFDSNNSYVFYCKDTAGDPTIDWNDSTQFYLRFGGGYGWYQGGYCRAAITENGGNSWYDVVVNGYYIFGNSQVSSFTTQVRSHREFKYNGFPYNGYTNANFSVSGINQGDVLVGGSSFQGSLRMKLPLPGNKNWLLTVQAGGAYCGGGTDNFHTNASNGYYSLDFDDKSSQVGQESNVPIYAAAGGTIDNYGYDANGYGYWVRVDHGNGFKSLYAHMTNQTLITSGDVSQGAHLGYVGTTGNSSGTHLHFQLTYNGDSLSTTTMLDLIRMEGKKITEYLIGSNCSAASGYYPSTNTQ